VLGPVGAAMLGIEDRDEHRWAPQVRTDRQLSLERSPLLGRMTGAELVFVALARHPECNEALARCAALHRLDDRRFHGQVNVAIIERQQWERYEEVVAEEAR
jgi:hypothetical protein